MNKRRNRQAKKSLSFRTMLIASLIVVSIFMAIYMGVFSARLSTSTIEEMSRRLSENSMTYMHNILDGAFRSAQDTLTRIIRMNAVQDIALAVSIPEEDVSMQTGRLNSAVKSVLYSDPGTNDIEFAMINLYFENGLTFSTLQSDPLPFDNFSEARAYFTALGVLPEKGYSPAVWCGFIRFRDNIGRETNCIMGIRMLYDGFTMEERGMMVYAIDEGPLSKRISELSRNAALMLRDGTLVSGPDKRLLGNPFQDEHLRERILRSGLSSESLSFRENDETRIVSYKMFAYNDLYLVVPFDFYVQLNQTESEGYVRTTVYIAAGGVILSLLLSLLISRMLSASVLSLKNVVGNVYDGDMDARFTGANISEISYLGDRVNDMLDSIKGFFEIQAADNQAKRDLEVRLMQSQINPHLLYNTLDSVLWALNHNKTELVEELVSSMSDFFKLTLSGGSEQIPLEEELAIIKSYLDIQRLARGKNIKLEISVQPGLLGHPVNKLTLQPIVENTIMHGFSGYREDDGRIEIKARTEGGHLILTVTDNGIGIFSEDLDELNATLRKYPPEPGQRHFGLYNINRRISGQYSEGYGLRVESEVGEYTRVTVDMPLVEPPTDIPLVESPTYATHAGLQASVTPPDENHRKEKELNA